MPQIAGMRGTATAFPDYGVYDTPTLKHAFAAGPARLREAIAGLSESELRTRARGEERWSIHEIILHVADSETQGAFRVRKVFAEPPSILPIHDQDVWSRALDYQGQDAGARERALALIGLVREQAMVVYDRATDHDWWRTGTHPEWGVVTLRNLLELYADHIERHIEQILDTRERLGRALAFTSPLPRRLY